uniref:Uncharacterized protein n=1 Tax=Anopheles farauti TaxID=69004 RepID=A0A182QQW5_9DIPT
MSSRLPVVPVGTRSVISLDVRYLCDVHRSVSACIDRNGREGDISQLKVDAITNSTDETLTEKNRVSKKIFGRAGAALTSAIVHDVRSKYGFGSIDCCCISCWRSLNRKALA